MDVMRSAAAPAGDEGPTVTQSSVSLARPKILLYSPDTCGPGNLRRTLALAEFLGAAYPRAAIRLLTGPMVHALRLPPRLDCVKLPGVDRVPADGYERAFPAEGADDARGTRRAIVERTALAFAPDLFIVERRAAGIDRELLPALDALRRLPSPPRVVLGLRDILDAPAVTRRAFRNDGSFDVIERFYDEVWIYGSRDVFDAIAEYEFPPAVAARSHFCGYLRRHQVRRAPHAVGPPRILVTAGGGGDAAALVLAYLRGLARLPIGEFQSIVVLGPQLDADSASWLRTAGGERRDIEYVESEADMPRRYAGADVVLATAGYTLVCELLAASVRAVLVPRAEPVQDQLIRARRLSAQGGFRMIEPADLTPDRLIQEVRAALTEPATPVSRIDMEGFTRIRARVQRLLGGRDAWS